MASATTRSSPDSTTDPDERAAVDPVGIEDGVDEAFVDRRATMEAKVEAAVRELLEEPDERLSIRFVRAHAVEACSRRGG